MTTERDPQTRTVLSWLREDAHEDAERLLLRALDEVDTTPQRRPRSARRVTDMNTYAKLAIAIAAVVVVAVAGFQLLPRTGTGTPGAQPTATPSPTASPTPTAAPSAMAVRLGSLEPGQHAWIWDGPDISFRLSESGWTGLTGGDITLDHGQPTEVGLTPWLPGLSGGFAVTHVYADACRSEGALEPFDGTLQGLLDALDAQVSTDITVTDTTFGGRPAKQIVVAPSAGVEMADCRHGAEGPLQIWADPDENSYFALPPTVSGTAIALEIDGELAAFNSTVWPEASTSNLAELEAVIASTQIGP
jgi:hypothetical protein